MKSSPRWRVALLVKRGLDLFGALSGIVLLAPVMIVATVAIRLMMGSPVLFRQVRPGLDGIPFTIYKFRTMKPATKDEVWFRTDAARVTPLGAFLRKTSIDELPELINVIRGEMSLVGPRPLLLEYIEKYTSEEMRRHEMRPGITGWAQVNGRQTIPFSERLRMDIWYVDNWSLWLDCSILVKTLMAVFFRKDVLPGQDVDDVDDIGLSEDRSRPNMKGDK